MSWRRCSRRRLREKESAAVFDVAGLRGRGPEAARRGCRAVGQAFRRPEYGSRDFVSIDLTYRRGLAYSRASCSSCRRQRPCARSPVAVATMASSIFPVLGFGHGDVVLGELLKERGVALKASTELGAFLIAVARRSPDDTQLAHALRSEASPSSMGSGHAGCAGTNSASRPRPGVAAPRRIVARRSGSRARGPYGILTRPSTEAKVPIPPEYLKNGYFH